MKVALLGPCHPYRGGIAHYTTSLARTLGGLGHTARIFNFTRQYPALLFPGRTQLDETPSAFTVDAVRVVDSVNPQSWREATSKIASFGAELLAVQWWHPFFAPAFGTIARMLRAEDVEVAFVCHNVLPHESSPVDGLLARYAFRSADRFVVHAQAERARLLGLVRCADVVTIAHPVYEIFDEAADTARVARTEARARLGLTDERVLLFFGLIRPYKGLDVLLDALPRCQTEPGPHLVVAGEVYGDDGPYRERLRQPELDGRVTFINRYVDNDEVPVLMAAADAVVLPYRHATQSGVAQVAFACGRAVISTRVGGIPDVVSDSETGLLVPPDDPDALAAAIDRFYDDALREPFEDRVIVERDRFGWEPLAHAVLGTTGETG